MFSLIGSHFPALVAVMTCIFMITLLFVSISDNWAARQGAKRKRAADREVSSASKVPTQ